MNKAARIGDASDHPGGMISGGPPLTRNVWIEKALAAVAGDAHVCTTTSTPHANKSVLLPGDTRVFIGNALVACVGDKAGCGAAIKEGASRTWVG